MNVAPSFQFYPKDVLSDSRCLMMTNEELGAYFKALCICWVNDGLPADEALFCRLINTTPEIARVVQGCFNQHPTDASKLWHKRFEEERQKQIAWRNKSSEGGKKSAELRKIAKTGQNDVKGGSTTVARVVQGSCNTPSSSPSPSSVVNIPPSPLTGGTAGDEKTESFQLDADQPQQPASKPKSKRDRKPAQDMPAIPESLDTPAFRQCWKDFIDHRKSIRKPLSPKAAELNLKKCLDMGHDAALVAIEQTIANGWTGIFEPKNTTPGVNGAKPKRDPRVPAHIPDHQAQMWILHQETNCYKQFFGDLHANRDVD